MDGGKQDDLLGGEVMLEVGHGLVGAATEGSVVHDELAVLANDLFRAADGGHLALLGVPLADGYGGVVVVGADEDDDGVEVLSVLGLEFLGLTDDLVHLMAVDAVDERLNAEDVLEEVPEDVLLLQLSGVGDGVAEIGHLLAIPLADDFGLLGFLLLGAGGHVAAADEEEQDEGKVCILVVWVVCALGKMQLNFYF